MNKEPKMVSFKAIIDLEPKPKKVKYGGCEYQYDDAGYQSVGGGDYVEDSLSLKEMSEPNIEIIEEDVVIEKLDMSKDADYYYTNDTRYNELVDEVMYTQVRLQEVIDLLNKKGQGND